MKALIWILVLILIGLGVWYYMRDDVATDDLGANNRNGALNIQAETDADVDLTQFDSKG